MRFRPTFALLCLAMTAPLAAQTARPSRMFDSRALLDDLKTLSADDMNGRAIDTPDSAKARAYLVARLTAAGLKPLGPSFESPFSYAQTPRGGGAPVDKNGVNLVGVVTGTTTPGRYVVVTAHYDHLAPRNGQIYNGADDNASGAAALIAIVSYFASHPPAHSLLVVECDGEEANLRGAKAFAAAPPVPAASMIANVNLDMIGRDPDDKLFAVGTVLNPFLKHYVEDVAKTAPVKLLMGHDDPSDKKVEDWTRDSDHFAFWEKYQMPFIYLGVEDDAQHHRPTDDYSTITHDFYVRAVETAIQVIQTFDAHLEAIAAHR